MFDRFCHLRLCGANVGRASRRPALISFAAPFPALLVALTLALWPLSVWAGTIAVDGATCTLPEAVGVANLDASADGCTLDDGAAGAADTLNLTAGTHALNGSGAVDVDGLTAAPNVTSDITVVGQGVGATVERTGDGEYRLFHVAAKGRLSIENVTITNFYISWTHGGAIYNLGALTLTNSSLISNTAVGGGGGIYNSHDSTATLTDSYVISNSRGGIVNFYNSTVTLTNSHVVSNMASEGGGISNIASSTATLTNSYVVSNTATYAGGGGISNSDGSTATLTDSYVISNTAVGGVSGGGGGGISNDRDSTVILTNSHVVSNTAPFGGGIYNLGGSTATLTDSYVVSNTAIGGGGGGITNESSTVTVTTSRFIANRADSLSIGGAFYQDGDGSMQVNESCIVNNSDISVYYNSGNAIVATNNWWGAADGPSGVGSGWGDSVTSDTDFSGFKTSAILGCPRRPEDVSFAMNISPAGDLFPGQPVTYTLTITNNDFRSLSNLLVQETLPTGFEVTDVTSLGVSITQNGNDFQFAPMSAGAVATITIRGTVSETLTRDTTLVNTALLSHNLVRKKTATVSSNVVVPLLNDINYLPRVKK